MMDYVLLPYMKYFINHYQYFITTADGPEVLFCGRLAEKPQPTDDVPPLSPAPPVFGSPVATAPDTG